MLVLLLFNDFVGYNKVMKIFTLLTALFIITPQIASAQSLQVLFPSLTDFIYTIFIPFLFGIAFLIFIYNAVKYFVVESNNEKGRENAKNLALYSIGAFVFLIIFSGLVRILTEFTGLEKEKQVCPDYLAEKGACTKNPPTSRP